MIWQKDQNWNSLYRGFFSMGSPDSLEMLLMSYYKHNTQLILLVILNLYYRFLESKHYHKGAGFQGRSIFRYTWK